jgi:hypothetical protein
MKPGIKDQRISQLRDGIALGNVQKFQDIIDYLPKTQLQNILGTGNTRITKILEKPQYIIMQDLVHISNSYKIPLPLLGKMAVNAVLFNRGEELIPINGIYRIKTRVEEEMKPLVSNG